MQLAKFEEQYKAGNYTPYLQLNNLFQKAISRARLDRWLVELGGSDLLNEAKNYEPLSYTAENMRSFAPNEQELKARIKENLLTFLHNEIKRYGEAAIANNITQANMIYERSQRATEEQYNYRQENGELLTAAQQENLFTLHVLKSLAKSLDAHTAVFDPSEAYDMKVRLEKGFDAMNCLSAERRMAWLSAI